MREEFVEPFEELSTRHQLYEGYLRYTNDLSDLINPQKYIQWIDGSFRRDHPTLGIYFCEKYTKH